jgi:spore maturation protein A
MKLFGACLRYLLNINTIWGLMILFAFGLCVWQHYTPTHTFIPQAQVKDGDNRMLLRIAGKDNKINSYPYDLVSRGGGLTIASADRVKTRPWLISAEPVDGGYEITWDASEHGKFEVALNGTTVDAGNLVTLQSLTDAAFEYAQKGFEIALGLVASMVLFLGLMKVGEEAGIVQIVARLFHPVIRLFFPQVPKDHPASGAILMNMTTTLLGLGNAATPFGLKAMKDLQELNPHKDIATDSQVMMLAYNTAGMALLPTTLLAVRKAAGCSDPFEIIGTCMITGAISTIVAMIASRVLARVPLFSVKAALAERTPEEQAAALLAEQKAASEEAKS